MRTWLFWIDLEHSLFTNINTIASDFANIEWIPTPKQWKNKEKLNNNFDIIIIIIIILNKKKHKFYLFILEGVQ